MTAQKLKPHVPDDIKWFYEPLALVFGMAFINKEEFNEAKANERVDTTTATCRSTSRLVAR